MRISQKAESFRKNRIRRHAWQRVVFGAACVVVFCTVYALILPAITMEEDVFCGVEEHTHLESCYEQRLVCTLEEGVEPHTHDESCYEIQSTLTCTLPQEEGHTHTEDCYDPENPEVLTCTLEQTPGHTHTEERYQEESVLICTLEEGVEPHTHGEECYESVLTCEIEEHTHSLLCYSDPDADVEKRSQWERTLPDNLTGDWAQDIVAIAQSQLGYSESSKNYTLAEDGSKKGYTRYGDWYGNPHGEWCAMFVSFCGHYAGIPQEAKLYEMSCLRMVNNLTTVGVYHEASDYQPQPGDIVFFHGDENTMPSHVGIVVEVGEKLITIEGNRSDKVGKGSYDLSDAHILGYASMAEIAALYQPAPTEEPTAAPEEFPETTPEPTDNTEEKIGEVSETAEADTTAEPTAEPTPEPVAEPTVAPTLALAQPQLSILTDEEGTTTGTTSALAQDGETVYFRMSLTQPTEQSAQDTSATEEPSTELVEAEVEADAVSADDPEETLETADTPIESESPSTEPLSEEEPSEAPDDEPHDEPEAENEEEAPALDSAETTAVSPDPSPMLLTLPSTSGLFDWRLEDTTEPGAVWVMTTGNFSLHTGENGIQYLTIGGAESATVRLTLPAGEVYTAFANNLSNKAETVLTYEGQQASVTHTLITDNPVCGLTAHIHIDTCYDEEGALTCTLPVHTHTELCYLGNQTTFTYEDGELAMSVVAYSREPLPENTQLNVEPLEDEEACLRYADFAQTLSPEEGATLLLRHLSLTADGEIIPEDSYRLVATVQVNADVTNAMVALLDLDAAEEIESYDKGILVTALNGSADTVTEGDSVLAAIGEIIPALTVTLQNNDIALLATPTANPTYTVQYYAYIPRFATSGDKSITVFDTTGKNLPKNNQTNAKKNLYLNASGSKYVFATVDELTKMYEDNTYNYIKAPNPSYINKLLDNASYNLDKIWVLKSGGDSASTDESNWDIYNPDSIHFTNREDIADASEGIVYLSDTSVLRMVYKVGSSTMTTPATFYDYDISTSSDSTTRFMTTGAAGINSAENYGKTSWEGVNLYDTSVFAFGNSNCGTGLGYSKYQGLYLNAYSTFDKDSDPHDNEGCTFNLVKSTLSDDTIQFNVLAPKIFNDGDAKGKTTFKNSSLTFTQVGDTYTLSSATVSGAKGASDLDVFFHPTCGSTTHTHILTNNFWPMDNATGVQDFMFGNNNNRGSYTGLISSRTYGLFNYYKSPENESLPKSDDGVDHNSFFGMQFAISFTLTADYIGPLEYYFFGDDDLWVFLDGELVCDIGGVHSSVGEYVNLWDYIDRNTIQWDEDEEGNRTKAFKLTFFYTERGASGSTCFMNFTLPSVTGATISQKTGSLKVEKEVVGEHEPSEEFVFKINFTKADGTTQVLDDYVYTRYDSEGEEIESDLIIHDGGSFKLCAGEYVIIKYLPYGVQYHITEVTQTGYTTTCKVDGVIQEGNTAHSTIVRGATNTVTFTNTVVRKQLKLRKLGIKGASESIPLANVTFTLTDSSGNTVNVVSEGYGFYKVPLSSAGYIKDGTQYYIALARNQNCVMQAGASEVQLTLQTKADNDFQKWIVYRQKDGSYSFKNVSTGLWLDLNKGDLSNYTKIITWIDSSNHEPNECEKWFLQPNEDGSFTIKPRKAVTSGSTAVIDLSGDSDANGTAIQVYESNGSNAQKWVLVPVNEAGAQKTTTEVKTNEQGELTITNLLCGTYTLTEISSEANAGYKLANPIKVKVKADGTLELVEDANSDLVTVSEDKLLLQVQNVPVDKKLTIQKQVNGSTSVTDFKFTVTYEKDGETETEKITLQNNGEKTIEIPHGVTVTITEQDHDGFAVAYSEVEGETATVIANGSSVTIEGVTGDMTILATNTVHYSLPETGGTGTLLYATGGLLLCGSSLMCGLRKRRRKSRTFHRP